MPRRDLPKHALLIAALASFACVEEDPELLDMTDDPRSLELPPITLKCTTVADVGICQDKSLDYVGVVGTSERDIISVRILRDHANSRVQVKLDIRHICCGNTGTWESAYFNYDPQDPSELDKVWVNVELKGGDDDVEVSYEDSYDGITWVEGAPTNLTYATGGSGEDVISYFRYIDGGDGADFLWATSEADYIEGGRGADHIYALGGDDEVYGQRGDDEIEAGNGDNLVYGGDGKDWITGGTGVDEFHGGADNDHLITYGGNDILRGNGGNDYLAAGNGIDDCDGGNGNDDFDGCE